MIKPEMQNLWYGLNESCSPNMFFDILQGQCLTVQISKDSLSLQCLTLSRSFSYQVFLQKGRYHSSIQLTFQW